MSPKYKLNGGSGATLCKKCNTIISNGRTRRDLCNQCLEDLVNKFPRKNVIGLDGEEQSRIKALFPELDEKAYNESTWGDVCPIENGIILTYPSDVVKALICGIDRLCF